MSLPIIQVLDCSTAHVTPETARRMDADEDVGFTYYGLEHGWLVYVPPEEYMEGVTKEDRPDDLWRLVILARENGCSYVLLDADAPYIDELPTYEW